MDGVGNINPSKACGTCSQFAVFKRLNDYMKTDILSKPLQIKYQVDYPYFNRDDISTKEILDCVEDEVPYLVKDWESLTKLTDFAVKDLWSILNIRQLCKHKSKLIEVLGSSPEFCDLSEDQTNVVFHFEPRRPVINNWCLPSSESEGDPNDDQDWGEQHNYNQDVDIDTSANCWQ
jgi:hypothetical protein